MASDPPCPQKPYKVWNFDKTEGRIIAASKLEELQLKAKTKFDISTNIKLVLEDGCIIDDEEAFQMLQGSISEVFCLKEGESLSFAGPSSQSSPSAGNTSHLLHLVQRIKNKQTSLHSQPKRRKSTINLNFGWMVFDETSSKFCQIRSPRGGGTRIMEMRLNSTYDDLLEIGKSTFFPNGVSHLGIVEEYNHEVGDFCGKAITAQAENFTLETYVLNLKMTTKPRLYLLSKKKVQQQEEESNESWELPDIPEIISNHPRLEEPDIPAIPDHLLTEQASGDMAQAIASPVTIRMPQMPTCTVCTERFSDTFFIPCGHIACTVCAAELEERGQQCHICRDVYKTSISVLDT